MIEHYWDAHRYGVSFTVTPAGTVQIHRGSLRSADIAALKPRRARLIAEWLWLSDPVPAIAWDPMVAEAVLAFSAEAMGPAGVPDSQDEAPFAAWQQAVDAAWAAQSLPRLTVASRQWTFGVWAWQAAALDADALPGAS